MVWTNAVDSLGAALRHYRYDPTPDEYEALASRGQLTARQFVHRHMLQIVNILLDQYASKTGHNERACVEGSLRHSVAICATDLGERAQFLRGVGGGRGRGRETAAAMRAHPVAAPPDPADAAAAAAAAAAGEGGDGGRGQGRGLGRDSDGGSGDGDGDGDGLLLNGRACRSPFPPLDAQDWRAYPSPVLPALSSVLDKRKIYYGRSGRGNWINGGLPDVRLQNVAHFRLHGGPSSLVEYLAACAGMFGDGGGDGGGHRHGHGAAGGGDGSGSGSGSGSDLKWPFPPIEDVARLLPAVGETVPFWSVPKPPKPGQPQQQQQQPQQLPSRADDAAVRTAIELTRPVLFYLTHTATEQWLKVQEHDALKDLRRELVRLMDRVGPNRIMPPAEGQGDGKGGGGGGGPPRRCTSREEYNAFHGTLNGLVLRYLTSSSLPLRLLGWEELDSIICHAERMRPPPRQHVVEGAGCGYVNGVFHFGGDVDAEGWAVVLGSNERSPNYGDNLKYLREVPADDIAAAEGRPVPRTQDGPASAASSDAEMASVQAADAGRHGGKMVLTLFQCGMRSGQKWWFLSEADPDQPGTDKDVDYYQHKSKTPEDMALPPRGEWLTCSRSNGTAPGIDPPPTLRPRGLMVPQGLESMTLEAQLSAWAVENGVVEIVLGGADGGGTHREIVSRSARLIRFMAAMGKKLEEGGDQDEATSRRGDGNVDIDQHAPGAVPGRSDPISLSSVHLSLAWKTYMTNPDDSVKVEVCRLLVSVLTSLSDKMATSLLNDVRQSLQMKSGEASQHMADAVSFCSALASEYPVVHSDGQPQEHQLSSSALSSPVRSHALELFWSVLTHEGLSQSSDLDNLREYVRNELRYHPNSRMTFLDDCRKELERYAGSVPPTSADSAVNEGIALRTVGLTRFVLEACPPGQGEGLVAEGKEALTGLLFRELAAYLRRRKATDGVNGDEGSQNLPSVSSASLSTMLASPSSPSQNAAALMERLDFMRYAYTLSNRVQITTEQLSLLWQQCGEGGDREALMMFLSGISDKKYGIGEQKAGPAFADDVRLFAFQSLFCSSSLDWSTLGINSYRSFQALRRSLPAGAAQPATVDALWRICLTAGAVELASQALVDLLLMYGATSVPSGGSFGERVFDSLVRVKSGLQAGDRTSEREAERCLRILSEALKLREVDSRQQPAHSQAQQPMPLIPSPVSSSFLYSLSSAKTVTEVLAMTPHGLRGEHCRIPVGILTKSLGSVEQGRPRSDSSGGGASSARFGLELHPLETLSSVKAKVARHSKRRVEQVKPISISGGSDNTGQTNQKLKFAPDLALVADLGIQAGCEFTFLIGVKAMPVYNERLSGGKGKLLGDETSLSSNKHHALFETLFGILDALPNPIVRQPTSIGVGTEVGLVERSDSSCRDLVWEILNFLPTNEKIADSVVGLARSGSRADSHAWSKLLDPSQSSHQSVYILQVIDSFLNPAKEILSTIASGDPSGAFLDQMLKDAALFRHGFIESGGFGAVLQLFTISGSEAEEGQNGKEMSGAFALRIIKRCFLGDENVSAGIGADSVAGVLDDLGRNLLGTLSHPGQLLLSLTSMVRAGRRMADIAILDVIQMLRLVLLSDKGMTEVFLALPNGVSEEFLISLLLWDRRSGTYVAPAAADTSSRIRRWAQELTLSMPLVSQHALPWLIKALDRIDCNSDSTEEFFSVMQVLVEGGDDNIVSISVEQLRELSTAVCRKIASIPRNEAGFDQATAEVEKGVLCGCFRLLRELVKSGGGVAVREGVQFLLDGFNAKRWSQKQYQCGDRASDLVLIDLMGAIFDGYLAPVQYPLPPSSSDDNSRELGFDVVTAAAQACKGGEGYSALVQRIEEIILMTATSLRHQWAQSTSSEKKIGFHPNSSASSKFSGLKNQGCTCYMNSVLQQLFMMPGLQERLVSANLPLSLRSVGAGAIRKGSDLVGKMISLHWESGSQYDALVKAFDEKTGMHTIQYNALRPQASQQDHTTNDIFEGLPMELLEEFSLQQGRPGKETGVFEVLQTSSAKEEESLSRASPRDLVKESEEEAHARRLLEEVQRTFVNLAEGLRGRCFDPCSLVEASSCLKLEFDIWQQNDASEFAVKLLDRLEVPLKRWSPNAFKYLENTFSLKQTKQKICKECGLKTNREEHFMNIDCQIQGKSDIHEALSTICEVDVMEGDNQVFCEVCKKNCDTVLRSAISRLPNMLVLSLKRFDLDYNTFETVKINSRCSFGETLNMKRYTLEGVDLLENMTEGEDEDKGIPSSDTEMLDSARSADAEDPLSSLPDEEYEYKLAGALIHAGVAQGGHYYSFIRDRTTGQDTGEDKWYRFDDEDVTPFDPSLIEQECFGGTIKKETKWPNGQAHTIENERIANALMLFYEKVKPSQYRQDDADEPMKDGETKDEPMDTEDAHSGFDAFQPDVQRSNKMQTWLDFLLDCDFQNLLMHLTNKCLLSARAGHDDLTTDQTMDPLVPWRLSLFKMVFAYFFDILLHSTDGSLMTSWADLLSEVLLSNKHGAPVFIHDLARRTSAVSGDWLRTYALECPGKAPRIAAVQVFRTGIEACASLPREQQALQRWTHAWKAQINEFEAMIKNRDYNSLPRPVSSRLGGAHSACEDISKFGQDSSAIGAIISHVNVLLDFAPRSWRNSEELFGLIRDLACISGDDGELVKGALIEAQIPARLVCIAVRHNSEPYMQEFFPAASMKYDVVELVTKSEIQPSNHMIHMNNSHRPHGASQGNPNPSDLVSLFEGLGCLLGDRFLKRAPLLTGNSSPSKASPTMDFTEKAKDAVAIIYGEFETNELGIGERDMCNYLLMTCGGQNAPQRWQKIVESFNTVAGVELGREVRYLSLDGFTQYCLDSAQRNEPQFRRDLHLFSFRPDLSRLPADCRYFRDGDSRGDFSDAEKIALDISMQFTDRHGDSPLGTLFGYACLNWHLFSVALEACDILGQYILGCFAYRYAKDSLIGFLDVNLTRLASPQQGWAADKIIITCQTVCSVLAALPDELQEDRIRIIMRGTENSERNPQSGRGLLTLARELARTGRNQALLQRSLELIKGLDQQSSVRKWMYHNRELWSSLAHYLYPEARVSSQHHQQRGFESSGHRDHVPINQSHSDSDMNTGLPDSEDDDDSQFGNDGWKSVKSISVRRAGMPEVNGTYTQSGTCDQAPKYFKDSIYEGEHARFQLFRCKLTDDSRRFYISIVPDGTLPGTSKDRDFYSASGGTYQNSFDFPPRDGWNSIKGMGQDPPPILDFNSHHDSNGNEDSMDEEEDYMNDYDESMDSSNHNAI